VRVSTEVISSIASPFSVLKVIATNAPDTSIVTIILEQTRAVGKEIYMRDTIIFQDDTFLYLLEKPRYRADRPNTTTPIHFRKEGLKLAWPIDIGTDE
jgi:hypothetical protein